MGSQLAMVVLAAGLATVAQSGIAWAASPGLTRDGFESEFASAVSGYVGFSGNLVLGVDGSIGGGPGRISVNGLLEPGGTSELAVSTAAGLRFQQLCRFEETTDGTLSERCVDRMTRAGRDFGTEPWFPAAGSPFDSTTVFRLGDRILDAMDADIATLRRPQVTYAAVGSDDVISQTMTAISGGTTLRYSATSTADGWTVVSTRDGTETGRITLAPAPASVGTDYPGEESLAPRFSVWTAVQGVGRQLAKAGARPPRLVRASSLDAPDAAYLVCVRGSERRPSYVVLGTQSTSAFHWRWTSSSALPDVQAYPNPAPGLLPTCASVKARPGPRVVVR